MFSLKSKFINAALTLSFKYYQRAFKIDHRFDVNAWIFSQYLSFFYPKIHMVDSKNRSEFLGHAFKSLLLGEMDNEAWLVWLRDIRYMAINRGGTCIVVESLTWGGAGKTQVILSFIEKWQKQARIRQKIDQLDHHFKLSILCHGYGKVKNDDKVEVFQINQLKNQQKIDALSLKYGDEFACLFVQAMSGIDLIGLEISLIVGGSWQAKQAKAKMLGVDLMICDGGGWRKNLTRNLNVVMIDCQQKWQLLPFGFFKSVMDFKPDGHLYLFNHSAYYQDHQQVRDWLSSKKPLACYAWIDYRYLGYRRSGNDELHDLKLLKGRKICLITAVAMATRVKFGLEQIGLEISSTLVFRDHFDFREEVSFLKKIDPMINRKLGNVGGLENLNDEIYLTTFKDWVKLDALMQIDYLEIEVVSTWN